jgi:predicted N-formylglutamate amidohydrolase
VNAQGILVSCEHATAAVPAEFRFLFKGDVEVLKTHRAFDPGAEETANELCRAMGCRPPFMGSFTRLLIDLNRSLDNPAVYSEFSPPKGDERRVALVEFHQRYRRDVSDVISQMIKRRHQVIHLSVHTFTPCLRGKMRNADIGLLFDPRSAREKEICLSIWNRLRTELPLLRVRLNYPYRGTSDGITRTFRRLIGDRYAGIELELNHGIHATDKKAWNRLRDGLVGATRSALEDVA